jgi:hypothetical protein
MATQANISRFKFKLGTNASPQVLTDIEEVLSVSPGVGKTNQLLDVTNFDSDEGTREYIAGLGEGDEFTVECNWRPGATMQVAAIVAVENGHTRRARLIYTGSSPNRSWTFNAVCLGYTVVPSATEQNKITFTYKVSGAITRV